MTDEWEKGVWWRDEKQRAEDQKRWRQ